MKQLFLPLLLILSYCSAAQNYTCLKSGVKRYFINSDNYLRGVRVDSVTLLTDTTVYYLFHTVRGNYTVGTPPVLLDSTGGSWLGGRVLQLADGTFIFDNYSGSPVIIKTQANLGDSWIFQQDASLPVYYRATFMSADTMQVSGVLDSVKYITINAYSGTALVASDPMNGYQILLSKNHGFQRVFDLYNFPYHNHDYYHDRCGNQSFELIPFISSTEMELYDWHIHNVYEYAVSGPYFSAGAGAGGPAQYLLDTVNNISGTVSHTTYAFNGIQSNLIMPSSAPNYYITSPHSGTLTCDLSLEIDTVKMPEEFGQTLIYRYYPDDSSFCMKSPLYRSVPAGIWGVEYASLLEYLGPEIVKKKYLGLVSYFSQEDLSINRKELIYYNRDGIICGKFNPLYVSKENGALPVEMFPNPVWHELNISAPEIITDITVSNLVGQVIYNERYNSKSVRLDVSGYIPGLYIIRLNNIVTQKFIKE